MQIQVSRPAVASLLGGMAAVVVLLHIVFAVDMALRHTGLTAIHWFFHLDYEKNIPSLFSYSLWLICAALLALNALCAHLHGHAQRWRWTFLVPIALFLALDEAMAIHETMVVPLRQAMKLEGLLHYAWVLPYAGLVLLLGVTYLRFLIQLPTPFARRFITAIAIFLSGALILEMGGGYFAERYGVESLPYGIEIVIEESLEMAGVIYFIDVLLHYLQDGWGGIRLLFQRSEKT